MNTAPKGIVETEKSESKTAIQEFMRSFELYEFPILDPNSHYREEFRRLWQTIRDIGDIVKDRKPEQLIAIGLRGSYSHGHPYEDNDVDLLFTVDGYSEELEDMLITVSAEQLAKKGFKLCDGKEVDGQRLFPVRFFDIRRIEEVLNCYMYGLDKLLYAESEGETVMSGLGVHHPLAEKKRNLLHSGILIPYLLWVYGLHNVGRVFYQINRHLPIPTRPTRYPADVINETKETLRQTYVARTLTGRPVHLGMATGYPIPELKESDFGSEPHREAEELFWALMPLREIYLEAIRKHIIQAKLENEVLGRRLSPSRILTFAPSYDGLVRRRLRAQWGKWENW
jgi:hypothetical protein